ncbi:MAG: type IVB secretion system protein IcmJDotN [Azoarcus sp.]|nr:type IVB secretion system protein IcmJDotN [Azoarcus sp.]
MRRKGNQPVLGVKRGLWRQDDEHALDTGIVFGKIRADIFARDNHTCRFCGWRSPKYQECHHVDNDHHNNEPGNMITACTLCHQVHHLGMCAMRGGGFLAVLPELTQVEVNNIARMIHLVQFASDKVDKGVVDKLQGLYGLFRQRGPDTLKLLFPGLDTSDPFYLAKVLSECDESLHARRDESLASIRLVPTRDAFHPGQLDFYARTDMRDWAPPQWQALTRQLYAETEDSKKLT